MRQFQDRSGKTWVATAAEESGFDYKGRFYLLFKSAEPGEEQLDSPEVRWNSAGVAERTLKTMSILELQKRLRTAQGRSGASAGA